jgi:hypothetical protein
MFRRALLVAAALAASACGGSAPALPPVTPAPVAACLTLSLAEEPSRENAYGRDVQRAVRTSFELAVVAAGFNVVADPALPHDLEAKLLTLPGSRVESGALVRSTIRLEHGGKVIDTLEASAGQEAPGYDGAVADQLVDALFKSAQLAAFTRDLRKPGSKEHLAAGALRAALAKGVCAQPEASAATKPAEPAEAPAPTAKGVLTGASQPAAFALIVGVDDYKTAGKAAHGIADAQAFAVMAKRTLGIPDGQIKLVLGDRADKIGFDLALDWLKTNVPAKGRVYFYFSGLGALRRGTSYLVSYESDLGALDKTGISVSWLYDALAKTRAQDVVVLLDAGYGGAGPRSAPAADGKPARTAKEPVPPPRVAVLSAVTGAEGAYDAESGGLFTRFLGEALGSGRADLDGDGRITLAELHGFIAPRLGRHARRHKQQQTPSIQLGPGMVPAAQITVASGLPEQ